MPLFQCEFKSAVLDLNTAMTVVLPQRRLNAPGGKFKTLLLLHGLGGDHTSWRRRTSIERYADFYQMAVVMPAAHRSFYADMAVGFKYWTHISQEVPRLARQWFALSDQPAHNFVAGVSMGGYGAFKLALNHPDRYAAAASLSGVLDLASRTDDQGKSDRVPDLIRCFGDPPRIQGTDSDLMHAAKQLVDSGRPIPRLYACCGTADVLYDSNLRFKQFTEDLGLAVEWQMHPGQNHEWGYWDEQILRIFDWLRGK